MDNRIKVIDYFRGFSIFTIIIYHYLDAIKLTKLLSYAIGFGGTGVHLFILISGFGLYLSRLKKPLSYPDFLVKRFSKVYIPAVIAVTAIVLISFFVPIYKPWLYAYLGHVFLYKMFDNSIIVSYGIHFWFISMIFQFYFVFPLIVKVKEKLSDGWFLGLGVFISLSWSVFVAMIGKDDIRVWNGCFIQYLWEFCLGMVLAERYLKKGYKFWEISNIKLFGITAISLILFALLVFKFGKIGKLFDDIPALFSYAGVSLLIFNFSPEALKQFFYKTGDISYSLYLYHIVTLLLVFHFAPSIGVVGLIIALVLTYAVAYLISKVPPLKKTTVKPKLT